MGVAGLLGSPMLLCGWPLKFVRIADSLVYVPLRVRAHQGRVRYSRI